MKEGEIPSDWRNSIDGEKDEKTKKLRFGGFIEKEYKSVGAEVLETQMPFDELQVLNGFMANIKKEFPYDIQVLMGLFS